MPCAASIRDAERREAVVRSGIVVVVCATFSVLLTVFLCVGRLRVFAIRFAR